MPNAGKMARMARDSAAHPARATRSFTDREDLRGAYHALVRRAMEEQFEDCYVINYYGIGGAGKTKLLEKLQEEVQQAFPKGSGRHILLGLDFDRPGSTDMVSALERLKEQLFALGFVFPRFEMALCMWHKKNHDVLSREEEKSFLERNPAAGLAVQWAPKLLDAVFPGAGTAAGLLGDVMKKIAPDVKKRLRDRQEEHKKKLYALDQMDRDGLRRNLPKLFSEDVNEQLQEDTVLHLFIDTYEQVSAAVEGDRLRDEPEWLYGPYGLIRTLGNAVFAIAGREKLRWEQTSEFWEGRLETHLIDHLSEEDSSWFLEQCGVRRQLWHGLYEMTGGEPVFLDVCVDQYLDLLDAGRTPELEDFGRDREKLVKRHVRYLPEEMHDALYLMAGMRRWNRQLFQLAAGAAEIPVNLSGYGRMLTGMSYVMDEGDGVFSMHQVVADILGPELSAEAALAASKALAAYAAGPLTGQGEPVPEEQLRTAELAVDAAAALAALAGDQGQTAELAGALHAQAARAAKQLRLSQALALQQQAADVSRAALGDEHPQTLAALAALALCWRRCGSYEKAQALYSQLYEARRRVLGPEDRATLQALSGLADIYIRLGRHDKAKALFEQAYDAQYRVLGPEDPDTLASQGYLAICLRALGDYARARELHEQVWQTRRRVLGDEHPDTLQSLGNLANCCRSLGEYDKARELSEQVWQARRRVLGDEYPDTLGALGSLANCYRSMGEYAKARELHEQVWQARRRVLGDEHPDTLRSLRNLADCCVSLGEYDEARELYEQLWQARRRVLGDEHPGTLWALRNLAYCYGSLGENSKARELYEQLWQAQRRTLGEEDPHTLLSLENLAYSHWQLGEYGQARELYEQVYEARRRLLGEDHPDTARARGALEGICALTDPAARRQAPEAGEEMTETEDET